MRARRGTIVRAAALCGCALHLGAAFVELSGAAGYESGCLWASAACCMYVIFNVAANAGTRRPWAWAMLGALCTVGLLTARLCLSRWQFEPSNPVERGGS